MIKNFINKILLTEQTIKAIGGVKEIDKNQQLFKNAELENMNTQGFYKQNLKDIVQKPQMEEIKKLRKAEKEIEKEIKDNAILKNEDMLFNSLTMRKTLGKKSKQQMNKDLKMVSDQLQDLKNNSKENDNYRQNLKIVLKRFFNLGKMSSRYVILPLSSQIPSDNILRIMNMSKDKESHLFNYMRDNREIIVDALDEEIMAYMSNNGYNFKKENDIYDNLCYTKNNAKINLLDELKKIGANVKNIDAKKKLLANKDPKAMEYKFIESEIKKLSEYRSEFEKRMEDIVDNKIDDVNVKDLKVVVLTWVPRMIMTQSTGTIWKSCMSLEHVSNNYQAGSNAGFVASGIQEGVFIAWLVNFNDIKTINDPIARILIKPFVLQSGEIVWWPSQIYHDGREANELRLFEKTCINYMIKKQSGLLKKENIVNVRNNKKVYSDSGDYNKKIIFYNKKMEIKDFIIAVDLDVDKITEYINNLSPKNINIENDSDFETINDLFNKIYKLNNFSLIKIFIDKVALLMREDSTYSRENAKRFLRFLENILSEKINKLTDKTIIYFLETFKKADIDLDFGTFMSDSKFRENLLKLLSTDNFEFINYLFQMEKEFFEKQSNIDASVFIAMNVIKNNKNSFPYILQQIEKEKKEKSYQYDKITIFLYLLRDIKNVKNFFDNNFKDYKPKKSFHENDLLFMYQIIEKIDNYHIKDSNKIKRSVISNLLLINDFSNIGELIRFFGDNYNFIDDELAEKIINSKIFKNEKNIYLKKINFNTNKKFLYAYLEKFIASKDVRLLYLTLEKFASDSFNMDDINKANEILNFIFLNLKKHNIKINIKNIFNYCIRKLEKIDSLDLIMNLIDLDTKEKIENIVYFYFFLLINNKQAEKFLVKNKIKKQEIINYLKKIESDNCEEIFNILDKADVFFSNEKEFENFLNKNKDFFDALSESYKYHSMIEHMHFNNRNFYLIFVLFSLKNNHYEIRNNFNYLRHHIFKFFSLTTLIKDFNPLERQLHEYIKQSFAKTNPETALGDLKIDIDLIKSISRNKETVFSIRFLYPMMKDFFESDFFEKIIKKINAITGNHKEMTEKLNFLQTLSVSYGEKINKNDIPKNLIKIIDKNKVLKNDIDSVKS
jgi:hypothetical protein